MHKKSAGANGGGLIDEVFNTRLGLVFYLAEFAKAAFAGDIIDFLKNAKDLIDSCSGASLATSIILRVALAALTHLLAFVTPGLAAFAVTTIMGWGVAATVAGIAAVCRQRASLLVADTFVSPAVVLRT